MTDGSSAGASFLSKHGHRVQLVFTVILAAAVGARIQVLRTAWKQKSKREKTEDAASTHLLTLGSRGRGALSPPLPYFNSYMKCLNDPCHPTDNPQGHVALCVAENKLVQKMLAKRFHEAASKADSWEQQHLYCYNNMSGLPEVRDAFARFLERYFWPSKPTSCQIDPDKLVISAGAASILNQLFFAVAEPGDAVLIPAPYYAAFEGDMAYIARCVPVPVEVRDREAGPSQTELEEALKKCNLQGLKVKILLLTNPNNPLGVVYSPTTIRNCVDWAKKNSLHTIVDEIYALSERTEKTKKTFHSIIEILSNELGDTVHFVWALSKDFGSSGLRVGLLYSQNEHLVKAFCTLNAFAAVSHPMQMLAKEILSDNDFVDDFLRQSTILLQLNYETCTAMLHETKMPYIHAPAGLFIYTDFSSLLPKSPKHVTSKHEKHLRTIFESCARVVMTPGDAQKDMRPGHFRICYAWVSNEVLKIAMDRIAKVIEIIRQMGLEQFNNTPTEELITSGTFDSVLA